MPSPVQSPTTDRLRADIDAGRAGDKVAGSDPAMAPLGTDDEAAGTAPSGKAVAEALREELKTPVPAPQPLAGPGHAWLLILVIVLFAAAMVGATLLWR